MGDIVNLRQARKARARTDAAQAGRESRARHGRTKAQRLAEERELARHDAIVDGARLEPK